MNALLRDIEDLEGDVRDMIENIIYDGMRGLGAEWAKDEAERCMARIHPLFTAILAAAEPAAPKEWRGPWKCERCRATWPAGSFLHAGDTHRGWDYRTSKECGGSILTHERRTGGAR